MRANNTFCSCNWRADAGQDATAQIEEHLRTAWPILIEKAGGENLHQWHQRVAEAHSAALERLGVIGARDGIGQPVRDGERIPFLSPEYIEANELVDVLEHQLEDLTHRLTR